jgi:hypothetical protein
MAIESGCNVGRWLPVTSEFGCVRFALCGSRNVAWLGTLGCHSRQVGLGTAHAQAVALEKDVMAAPTCP